ncbi:toxin-antitoxin system YwqK family antitoxin [Rufibacter soli]
MRTFLLIPLLSLFLFSVPAQAQSTEAENLDFYKSLTQDSVLFYYDYSWNLVEPACAVYYRLTKITPEAFFTGEFKDYKLQDSTLLFSGFYSGKKKNGLFKQFHENGSVYFTGNYQDDQRKGTWELFRPDGSLQASIIFSDNDYVIESAWDENGKQTVSKGNGLFEQEINTYLIKGVLKDGVPDGKWTYGFRNGTILSKEEFTAGKFIKGSFPNARTGNTYNDRSRIILLPVLHSIAAEKFTRLKACPKITSRLKNSITLPKYKHTTKDLTEVSRLLAERIIRSEVGRVVAQYKAPLKFTFIIDSNGKVKDIELASKNVEMSFAEKDETKLVVDVLRRALASLGDWVPGLKDGKPIDFNMTYNIIPDYGRVNMRFGYAGPVK